MPSTFTTNKSIEKPSAGSYNNTWSVPVNADWDDIDARPCRIGVTRDRKPYNKLAGFTRNETMLKEEQPDLLVVFPGGPGTAHCRKTALKLGIPTLEVDP